MSDAAKRGRSRIVRLPSEAAKPPVATKRAREAAASDAEPARTSEAQGAAISSSSKPRPVRARASASQLPPRSAALGTEPLAREAAERALAERGSAVDAVLAGFFAAAGASAGTLFAPAVMLVAGTGAGARAYDGRARQPGTGAARPRGFLSAADVPDAARAAVPGSIGMAMRAHAQRGRLGFGALLKESIAVAKELGATGRVRLLQQIGRQGSAALERTDIARALLGAAGLSCFGLVTEEDLAAATGNEQPAKHANLSPPEGEGDPVRVSILPFASPSVAPSGLGNAELLLAVDSWGLVAALAYHPDLEARCLVPELEVALPPVAVPVMRGKTRLAPGTPMPIPCSLAAIDAGASLRVVLATPGVTPTLARLGAAALSRPVDDGLGELAPKVVALIGSDRSARVYLPRDPA
jgi:hypothetical protein